MAEIYIESFERQRLSGFLKGRVRPKKVLPGTWLQLQRGTLEVIENADMLGLLESIPDLLAVIGWPVHAWGSNGKNEAD